MAGAIATYSVATPAFDETTTVTSLTTTTQTVASIVTIASTITTTSTINLAKAVSDAYLAHLHNIQLENSTAIEAEYEINATYAFVQDPLAGLRNTTGAANIAAYYAESCSSPCTPNAMNFANETYTITSISANGTNANIKSSFTIYGNYTSSGNIFVRSYLDQVKVNISYVFVSNGWLISSETWYYTLMEWCNSIASPAPTGCFS